MELIAYEEMARYEKRHWWFKGRRRKIHQVLSQELGNGTHSILEIGAGTGGNFQMLSEFGKVDMIEPSSTGRHFIERREDVPKDAKIFDLSLPDDLNSLGRKYDVVVLFDVLEHVEAAGESLCEIKKVLKEDGLLLLTVPAYMFMWSTHDDVLHHKRRYTKSRLTSDLTEAGYKIRSISYFNTLLFPLALFSRMFDKLSGAKHATGVGLPGSTLNYVLYRVFSFESKIPRWLSLPFGLSLIALAEPI